MVRNQHQGLSSEQPSLQVQALFEDNHCLVVNKPGRLLTTEDATGDATLESAAKDYIREKYNKPGNVYLSLIHRIDRPVTGCVLFARTSKAAARLAALFRERKVQKLYLALVEEKVDSPAGQCLDYLLKDEKTNTSRVVAKDRKNAQHAELSWKRLQVLTLKGRAFSLLEVRPVTGRSHQIRVQLSHMGHVIVGDAKYGASSRFGEGVIALHSYGLDFEHPTRDEMICVRAPLPVAGWQDFPLNFINCLTPLHLP